MINNGAVLDQGLGIGTDDGPELAEGPGVGTSDGPDLVKGPEDGTGLRDMPSDGMST